MQRFTLAVIVFAVAVSSTCSDGDGTDPPGTSTLTAADAAVIAEFLTAEQPAMPDPSSRPSLIVVALQTTPQPGPFTFNNTIACSGSGTTAISGSGNRQPNTQTRITTVTWTATGTHNNCRFSREGRQFTITSGSVSAQGTATFDLPAQQGGTPTLRTFQLTRTGTINISSTQFTGTCAVNLSTTWEAAQSRYLTTGTVCDRQVSSNAEPRRGLGNRPHVSVGM